MVVVESIRVDYYIRFSGLSKKLSNPYNLNISVSHYEREVTESRSPYNIFMINLTGGTEFIQYSTIGREK